MRYLIRNDEPLCLVSMRSKYSCWSEVLPSEKSELWDSLEQMQQKFCAFCEREMKGDKKHIEHFIARSRNNSLTFIWSNLFGSCDSTENCGRYKDSKVKDYNENNLIKPDQDNPLSFFIFLEDGLIAVKKGLSQIDELKAKETIRVFGLNSTLLKASRQIIFTGYREIAKTYYELLNEFDPNDTETIAEIVDEYKQNLEGQPFFSALFQLIF